MNAKRNEEPKMKKEIFKGNAKEIFANLYIYIMLCVFPLYFLDLYSEESGFLFRLGSYLDAAAVKFYFYFWVTVIFALIIFMLSLVNKSLLSDFKRVKINFVDIAFTAFILINVISAFISPYNFDIVFWGKDSRFNALALKILFFLTYIIITRYSTFKKNYIKWFLLIGTLVSGFGMADYFKMNVLSLKDYLEPWYINVFYSTIGNINLYSVFAGIYLTVAFILFCKNENLKKSIVLYIFTIIGYLSIVIARSDGAYIFIGSMFLFAPLYLFDKSKSVMRYFISLATFFISTKIIEIINIVFKDNVIGINDGLFHFLISRGLLNPLLIASILFLAICIFMQKFSSFDFSKYSKTFRISLFVMICVAGIVLVALFYQCNFKLGRNDVKPFYAPYLTLTDDWGSGRGYILRRAIPLFSSFPTLNKLFGIGTGGFIHIFNIYFGDETTELYNVYFDNPHNEYINVLIATGILGLVSFITFMVGTLIRLIKQSKDNVINFAILFAFLGYTLNSLINLDIPTVSPIAYVLLFIALTNCNNFAKSETEENETKLTKKK